jgi:putative flippase GtrA
MRLVRLLPERWQKFLHEAFKFGIVGALNTVVNFAVLNALILTVFPSGQLKANVIATVIATTASYFMNRHWTYGDRPKSALRREYALFFLMNGAGLAIELGVLGMTKYGLGMESLVAINAAKLLGLVLGTVFRFWAYRTFVFKPATAAAAPSQPLADNSATSGPVTSGPVQSEPVRNGFTALTDPLAAELGHRIDVALEAALALAADRARSAPRR